MLPYTLLITLFSNFTTNWTLYKDAEARFSVKVPCETMRHSIQQIKTTIGEIAYHSFICEPKDANAENKVYIISYLDYPEGLMHPDSTELKNIMIDETIQSSVSNVAGQLVYTDEITLKGVKGKLWRINYNNDKAVMKNKAFIVKNRLYLVQVATTRARSRNTEADIFLDSFSWF